MTSLAPLLSLGDGARPDIVRQVIALGAQVIIERFGFPYRKCLGRIGLTFRMEVPEVALAPALNTTPKLNH